MNDAKCENIRGISLRESCFTKLAQITDPYSLCSWCFLLYRFIGDWLGYTISTFINLRL